MQDGHVYHALRRGVPRAEVAGQRRAPDRLGPTEFVGVLANRGGRPLHANARRRGRRPCRSATRRDVQYGRLVASPPGMQKRVTAGSSTSMARSSTVTTRIAGRGSRRSGIRAHRRPIAVRRSIGMGADKLMPAVSGIQSDSPLGKLIANAAPGFSSVSSCRAVGGDHDRGRAG
jgi:hypothetical protein